MVSLTHYKISAGFKTPRAVKSACITFQSSMVGDPHNRPNGAVSSTLQLQARVVTQFTFHSIPSASVNITSSSSFLRVIAA